MQNVDERLVGFIRAALYSFIAVLFAGNVYFIRSLVDKVNSTEDLVFQLRQQLAVLSAIIDNTKGNYDSRIRKR